MDLPTYLDPATVRQMRLAMRLSLWFGVVVFVGKISAYIFTGSAAILSDAAESVVHVVAVGFAAFSLSLSTRPASDRFRYGYERIGFFSAGFEGALIVLAALYILVTAISKWIAGFELRNVGGGAVVVAAAALLNAALGWYLVKTGRRTDSLILEANGKHVLSDSWTSLGVIVGLGLVLLTGWQGFDPLCAIAVAVNILWSGGRLVRKSVSGLMDYADPKMADLLKEHLDELSAALDIEYHGLRFRNTGYRTLVELHLLFPHEIPVGEAHRLATEIEERLPRAVGKPLEVVTHLESRADHGEVHSQKHYTGV